MATGIRSSWVRAGAWWRLHTSSIRPVSGQAARAVPEKNTSAPASTKEQDVRGPTNTDGSITGKDSEATKRAETMATAGPPEGKRDIGFEQKGVQRLERLLKDSARAKLRAAGGEAVKVVGGTGGKGEPDPNKVKLGKTLRILQERLPTLLQAPLPQDILAPNISLHLFPSTYSHLPAVSGRVAYTAALWTSPIAWNRFPIIGNVRLEILSERMTRDSLGFAPHRDGAILEQLVVRWRTVETKEKEGAARITAGAGKEGETGRQGQEEFAGLYIFQFDKEGRILSHTIETAQVGGYWEKGVGAKVVGLTDWLLGEIKGRPEGGGACPAYERVRGRRGEVGGGGIGGR